MQMQRGLLKIHGRLGQKLVKLLLEWYLSTCKMTSAVTFYQKSVLFSSVPLDYTMLPVYRSQAHCVYRMQRLLEYLNDVTCLNYLVRILTALLA
jgi:hypothetical protein